MINQLKIFTRLRDLKKAIDDSKRESHHIEKLLEKLNAIIKKKIPDFDKDLGEIVSLLGETSLFNEAQSLITMIEDNLNDRLVRAWLYAGLLRFYAEGLAKGYYQARINETMQIVNIAQARHLFDNHVLCHLLKIYSLEKQLDKAIQVLDDNSLIADMYCYQAVFDSLIDSHEPHHQNMVNKLLSMMEEALQEAYKDNSSQPQDKQEQFYGIYITCLSKKSPPLALKTFNKAQQRGFLQQSTLKMDENEVILDFHGIPLAMAKIAIWHFISQQREEYYLKNARMITGGHFAEQSVLKRAIPDLLKQRYDIDVEWDENEKLLQFYIPYPVLRRAEMLEFLFGFLGPTPDFFAKKSELFNLIKSNPVLASEATAEEKRLRKDLRKCYVRLKPISDKQITIPNNFNHHDSQRLAGDGTKHYRYWNLPMAVQIYQKLCLQEPTHAWPLMQLGWVYYCQKKYNKAIDSYKEALVIAPQDDEIYRKLGLCYYQQEMLNEAENTFRKAITLNDTNIEALHNLGMVYAKQNGFTEAVEQFKQVTSKRFKYGKAWIHLGQAYFQLKQYAQAESCYYEAITLRGHHAFAYGELGKLYFSQYEHEKDTNYLKKAALAFAQSVEIRLDDEILQCLAMVYQLQDKQDEAEHCLNEAMKLNPLLALKMQHQEIQSITSVKQGFFNPAKIIKEKIAIHGLDYQEIVRDGHCLYLAVALHLGKGHQELRNIMAARLEKYPESWEFINRGNRTIEEYITAIRNNVEWEAHIEINALMHLLTRPIMIIDSQGSITNPQDAERFNGKPIFVYHNGHNHYDGLILKPEYAKRPNELLQQLLLMSALAFAQTVIIRSEDKISFHLEKACQLPDKPNEANSLSKPFKLNSSSATKQQQKATKLSMPTKQQFFCYSKTKREKIAILGLDYQETPGDGHCLYYAVAIHLGQDQQTLRNIVAARLECEQDRYAGFLTTSGRTVADYIEAVRNGQEWASHVEIELLMQLLDRPIIIVKGRGSITNRQDANRFNGEPIFVYYNGSTHYDGLLIDPNQGLTANEILQQLLTQQNLRLR